MPSRLPPHAGAPHWVFPAPPTRRVPDAPPTPPAAPVIPAEPFAPPAAPDEPPSPDPPPVRDPQIVGIRIAGRRQREQRHGQRADTAGARAIRVMALAAIGSDD